MSYLETLTIVRYIYVKAVVGIFQVPKSVSAVNGAHTNPVTLSEVGNSAFNLSSFLG